MICRVGFCLSAIAFGGCRETSESTMVDSPGRSQKTLGGALEDVQSPLGFSFEITTEESRRLGIPRQFNATILGSYLPIEGDEAFESMRIIRYQRRDYRVRNSQVISWTSQR